MDPILQKFRDKFFEESLGLLDRLEKDLLDLENEPGNKDLIESVFRAMHTIKGVSGMYGFDFICEFTHSMESLYQAIRDGKLSFNKDIFDITFVSVDHIRKLLSDEKMADPNNVVNHNLLIADTNKILLKLVDNQHNTISETPQVDMKQKNDVVSTWHIMMQLDEKVYNRGINLVAIFKELSLLGLYKIVLLDYLSDDTSNVWSIVLYSSASISKIQEVFMFIEENCIITRLSNSNVSVENKLEAENQTEHEISIQDYIEHPQGTIAGSSNEIPDNNNNENPTKESIYIKENKQIAHNNRISVDSLKLDNLMYLVSELITVNSQLTLSTKNAAFDSIRPYLEKVDALSKLFRNNTLEIRLVPLSDTILRFQRLIRDLSRQLGKKIELVTQGTDTELDKNTIDQLHEPLMHIIRNCIDHGIESPDKRVSVGKPAKGIIKISASQSGNFIVITVEDDGSGIDVEKVRLKAVQKDILKASDKPSRQEIFELIFLPGFSTAESLTEVSGRGVGMDVVRKKIIDLRGDIIVNSEDGVGTSFTLKLQQSVTIIDSLLFKVEDSFFTIPLSDIMICSMTGVEDIEKRSNTATLPYNDQLIPYVDLRKKLNIEGVYGKKIILIIIRNNNHLIALLTDKIVGEHQAVLKPLGRSFRNQEYITSASQLGDGNLAFMIDTNKLFRTNELIKQKIS